MKKITAFIFAFCLFANSSAYAGTIELDFSKEKPINASLRSAVLPGWGQMWNEEETKGWIVMGVFAVSVAGAFYFNHQAQYYYEKYENQGIINGGYYNDYERNYQTSQILSFVAIGTWLYAVIDAYVVCKKQMDRYTKTSSLNFYYNQYNDSLGFIYSRKI
ncbi:MAG: DUF5683 domain-containing protein [Endomicrobia bacterium]|nr:DUF5683 domain-containing protein [Endomicrobiia bacterium]MCL2507176.1 DUF5683 domain-containing protein [Endomicrobiia bacterium]